MWNALTYLPRIARSGVFWICGRPSRSPSTGASPHSPFPVRLQSGFLLCTSSFLLLSVLALIRCAFPDLSARLVAEGLRAKFNQPVIVENKPGANGVIGVRELVKSDPDAYTVMLAP